MYVFRRDVFQVHAVDLRADLHIESHARHGCDEREFQLGVSLELRQTVGTAGEPVPRRLSQSLGIYLLYGLLHLEKPGSAGDAQRFEGRGHGEADRLAGPGSVGHHEVRIQGIQLPCGALHGGIEGLQVYGDICAVSFHDPGLRCCNDIVYIIINIIALRKQHGTRTNALYGRNAAQNALRTVFLTCNVIVSSFKSRFCCVIIRIAGPERSGILPVHGKMHTECSH